MRLFYVLFDAMTLCMQNLSCFVSSSTGESSTSSIPKYIYIFYSNGSALIPLKQGLEFEFCGWKKLVLSHSGLNQIS